MSNGTGDLIQVCTIMTNQQKEYGINETFNVRPHSSHGRTTRGAEPPLANGVFDALSLGLLDR